MTIGVLGEASRCEPSVPRVYILDMDRLGHIVQEVRGSFPRPCHRKIQLPHLLVSRSSRGPREQLYWLHIAVFQTFSDTVRWGHRVVLCLS